MSRVTYQITVWSIYRSTTNTCFDNHKLGVWLYMGQPQIPTLTVTNQGWNLSMVRPIHEYIW